MEDAIKEWRKRNIMPFAMTTDCRCCKNFLWHCLLCWNKYHNGGKHNDYIPPKYFGQPMSEEVNKKMEAMGSMPKIKSVKSRKYEEHIYGHNR